MLKEFINICQLSQEQLLNTLPLYLLNYYKNVEVEATKDYIFAEGDIPVLLVAHLDTVHNEMPTNIWFSYDKDKIKADEGIGGDDRCGVYAICQILKHNLKPYVLFATNEEVGGIGTEKFCEIHNKLPVNIMIELDRKGSNDVVRYDDENSELTDLTAKYGYKEAHGSFTDICILCEKYGISGVNLSVGYYKQHTADEYVVFSELNKTINNVIGMLKDTSMYSKKIEYKSRDVTGIYDLYGYGRYMYNNDYICNCDICNKTINLFDSEVTVDGTLCKDCFKLYESNYRKCSNCGEWTYIDDIECEWCGYKEEDIDV